MHGGDVIRAPRLLQAMPFPQLLHHPAAVVGHVHKNFDFQIPRSLKRCERRIQNRVERFDQQPRQLVAAQPHQRLGEQVDVFLQSAQRAFLPLE